MRSIGDLATTTKLARWFTCALWPSRPSRIDVRLVQGAAIFFAATASICARRAISSFRSASRAERYAADSPGKRTRWSGFTAARVPGRAFARRSLVFFAFFVFFVVFVRLAIELSSEDRGAGAK